MAEDDRTAADEPVPHHLAELNRQLERQRAMMALDRRITNVLAGREPDYQPRQPDLLDKAVEAVGRVLAPLAGFLVFAACWIYCIAAYGFLFGVGLGWVPSFICGYGVLLILSRGWPFVLFLTGVLYLSHDMGSATQSDLSFPFDLLYTLSRQLVLLLQHWLDVVGLG